MPRAWRAGPSPPACGAYSHATAIGDTLYITGQLPIEPRTNDVVGSDVASQTDQVLANLSRVLELTRSSISQVVQARAFLLDADDFTAYDTAFRSWFPSRLPSRTTVAVTGFAIAGCLIEIDLVAIRSR
jgi:reactive intermediate/imine deaminase